MFELSEPSGPCRHCMHHARAPDPATQEGATRSKRASPASAGIEAVRTGPSHNGPGPRQTMRRPRFEHHPTFLRGVRAERAADVEQENEASHRQLARPSRPTQVPARPLLRYATDGEPSRYVTRFQQRSTGRRDQPRLTARQFCPIYCILKKGRLRRAFAKKDQKERAPLDIPLLKFQGSTSFRRYRAHIRLQRGIRPSTPVNLAGYSE